MILQSDITILERCSTPRGDIQLQYRNNNYEIISNGTFLMATYNGESERLLVKASLDSVHHPRKVMIGGLGVGFSLSEALKNNRVKEVVVLEIEEKIIEWNNRYFGEYSNHPLTDSRTRVVKADLLQWIQEANEKFDVICLDIDNGPDWTVTEANHSLYKESGLNTLLGLMNPGGVIAFWSANSSDAFALRLSEYFHEVEEYKVEVERGEPDVVYIAKLPK
ncbi:spermine/spermidine synthase [Brevibacillus laterosporus]|uniref:spermine/spermidine synthase domain-containing protein n=1 Tax=Brevibacillus laterosporus TaxID=1465 RepID=UPI0004CE93E8|nr:spermine/spermidine synthase [Brevibacillus laterosporus]